MQLLAGGLGEIDKKIDPDLTHVANELSYYVAKEFPITNNRVVVGTAQYGP